MAQKNSKKKTKQPSWKPKARMGRPPLPRTQEQKGTIYETKIEPRLDEISRLIGEHGYTQQQVAQMCGVSGNTFSQYKKRYPKLAEAIRFGNEMFNVNCVEGAIRKALLGGYVEEKEVTHSSKDGERITKRTKYQPPNMSAVHYYERRLHSVQALEARQKKKQIEALSDSITQKREVHALHLERLRLEIDKLRGTDEAEFKGTVIDLLERLHEESTASISSDIDLANFENGDV